MYDVVVVGAGHNGLTCAAFLARAGRRVLVLESEPHIGGMSTTRETVAEAPGYKMNPCAVDTLMTNIPRSVITELGLASYGYREAHPDPWGAYLGPEGESIGLWRDRRRTVEEIATFSVRDAERFDRFCEIFIDLWTVLAPYLQDHPTRPRARTVGELLWRAARRRRSLLPAAKLLLTSPRQLVDEWFEREEVRAMLTAYAAGSTAPLEEPGSGAFIGVMTIHFGWGITRPVGGMGSLPAALAAAATAHGAEVRVNSPVASVLVDDEGRSRGVRLASGEEIASRQVVAAIHPGHLINDLVDPQFVPRDVADEIRGLRDLGHGIGVTKVDAALSRRPDLRCGRPELWGSYMLINPEVAYLQRAIRSSVAGELPAEVPMWMLMPSAADRTQVPPGSSGDTLYLYTPTVPCDVRGGWPAARQVWADRVIGVVEEYAPGTRDALIGTHVKDPDELARMTGGHGSITHLDMSPDQMGPWRPTRSLSGYRTPVEGLWHAGAGAHPVGGVTGWSGRTVARTTDRALARAAL